MNREIQIQEQVKTTYKVTLGGRVVAEVDSIEKARAKAQELGRAKACRNEDRELVLLR